MKKKKVNKWLPYFNLLMIFFTLLLMLVLKMEVRRKGYVVLKKGNEYQRLQDEKRLKRMKYAQYLSPESLSISASKRLDMKKAIGGQIIYMSGTNIAVNH